MNAQTKQLAEWLQSREDKLIKVAADCAEAGLESASKYAWEEVSKIQELQIELAKCMESASNPVSPLENRIHMAKEDCLIWLRKIVDKSYKSLKHPDYHTHPDLIRGADMALKTLTTLIQANERTY